MSDLTVQVLHYALDGLSLRQNVIANDVANADTPGFSGSTVDFESGLTAALGISGSGMHGSRVQEVTQSNSQAQQLSDQLTIQLSHVRDLNMAQALTNLQQDQAGFQAALLAGSKVIQPTLVNFLQ